MSVAVGRGTTWSAGTPTKLIDRRYYSGNEIGSRTYDVSLDGKRFLRIKQGEGATAVPTNIEVVENWTAELKRLLPPAR